MNIKPIPVIQPYSVGSANEKQDEERRREKQKFDGKRPKNNQTLKSPDPKSTSNDPNKETTDANGLNPEVDLTRQLLDSEKVVEMLSHRNQKQGRAPQGAFAPTVKETTQSYPLTKKVNRSL